MLVIITGETGIGKTTVCRKLVEIARNRGLACGGVLTYKADDKSIIIEDIQSGRTELFASTDHDYTGPRTARYFFNPEGVEFGLVAIEKALALPSSLLVMDEVGPLELSGKGFADVFKKVITVRSGNQVVVIRSELLPRFAGCFPVRTSIFYITSDSRNSLPNKIFKSFSPSPFNRS